MITTLGILRPDPVTKEFILTGYYPFASIEEIKENTGWDLKVAPDVQVIPEPTAQELENLRAVDVTGSLRKK
jgi:glutaconate CoA-transferase subunit B